MSASTTHRARTRPEIDADVMAACHHLAELATAADAGQPLDIDAIGITVEGLRRLLIEREGTA